MYCAAQVGETADVAGVGGERKLQRGRVDADAQPSVAPGVRKQHVVHAVQQKHGGPVPGRLGEQAVHQSAVLVAAAGPQLSSVAAAVAVAGLTARCTARTRTAVPMIRTDPSYFTDRLEQNEYLR